MMATEFKGRVNEAKQDTAVWTNLFQNELKTEEESLVFVKRMMVLAVSSITYLRGIFPEDAYRSRYLEDVSVKILRESSSSRGACKIVKWIMGCFDALEKRYLQIVLIGVHTHTHDSAHYIETYQFKFRYTEQGPHMDILRNESVAMRVSMEDTKRASVLLIRKLFLLLQNLDPLPNDISLTMRLYYYDDVTPPEYEPPGFKEGVCDSMWFEGTAVHFKVDELQTPFHSMKVRVSVEQGRTNKLQMGVHTRETSHISVEHSPNKFTPEETEPCGYAEENLPSDDESLAQFKQPKKAVKRKSKGSKLSRRRKKKEL